jgi:hypothetical protein
MRRRMPRFALQPRVNGAVNSNALALYNAITAAANAGAYWEFEENDATTQFLDGSGNANHLTTRGASGTVATSTLHGGAGLISRSFYVNNGSKIAAYIPRSNTNLDLPNSDWTYGGWFQELASSGGGVSSYLMARNGGYSVGKLQSSIWTSSSDGKVHLEVSSDGNTGTDISSGVVTSSSEWQLITATLDRTNNLIRIRVKAPSGTNANVTAAFAGAMFTTSNNANFTISGAMNADGTYPFDRPLYLGGKADLCFYVRKAISDAEFDYLYNTGSGKTWAQLATDAGH